MWRILKKPQTEVGLVSEEESVVQCTHGYDICGTSRAKQLYSATGEKAGATDRSWGVLGIQAASEGSQWLESPREIERGKGKGY